MKKIILIVSIVVALFLSSCSEAPECNSTEVKELVMSVIKDHIDDKYEFQYMLLENSYLLIFMNSGLIDQNDINGLKENVKPRPSRFLFFENQVGEIIDVRTLDKNEELKRCECEGNFTITDEEKSRLKKMTLQINPRFDKVFDVDEVFSNSILYDVIITDDGDLLVEVEVSNYTGMPIMYSFIENVINKIKK